MKLRLLAAVTLLCVACSPAADEPQPTLSGDGLPGSVTTTAGPATTAASARVGNDAMTCWASDPPGGSGVPSFADVTAEVGLVEPLLGMKGHAAAWGDPNGDGFPDLAFGTFANRPVEDYQVRGASGPSPDRLLLGRGDSGFEDGGLAKGFGRTSGAAFADLDGDGDQDLVLARFPRDRERSTLPSEIFENVDGVLEARAETGVPTELRARSIGVLDFDRDGLLDLFLVADPIAGDSSALLHNLGGLAFEDVTRAAGVPDLAGLGVGIADLNLDGFADIVVGGTGGYLLGSSEATFEFVSDPVFAWSPRTDEDLVAGIAVADLNRDGLPDIVVGHHFNSAAPDAEVPVQLLVQVSNGESRVPRFEDVTDRAGVPDFVTKAPHVEVVDFDNDSWPDILVSASASSGSRPTVLYNTGVAGQVPIFEAPVGLGDSHYWVTTPTADFDRDGRIDILAVEWEQSMPSRLLRNVSPTGNWLEVSVEGAGVGSLVTVTGDDGTLIGVQEIGITRGYAAGVEPFAHFGLGSAETVDVEIRLAADGSIVTIADVGSNQHLRWPEGC